MAVLLDLSPDAKPEYIFVGCGDVLATTNYTSIPPQLYYQEMIPCGKAWPEFVERIRTADTLIMHNRDFVAPFLAGWQAEAHGQPISKVPLDTMVLARLALSNPEAFNMNAAKYPEFLDKLNSASYNRHGSYGVEWLAERRSEYAKYVFQPVIKALMIRDIYNTYINVDLADG